MIYWSARRWPRRVARGLRLPRPDAAVLPTRITRRRASGKRGGAEGSGGGERHLLALDERHERVHRLEVLRDQRGLGHHDPELFLEKHHQAQDAERVKDATAEQRLLVTEGFGILVLHQRR